MKAKNENQLREDFLEFMSFTDVAPSEQSRQTVFQNVSRLLSPTFLHVFKKLGVIQIFSGSVTLLFCPQFGIGPLGGGHGLMHTFMQMGPVFCALACGSLFLGTCAVVAPFFLTREERKLAARTGLWQFGLLGVASMALLMLVSTISTGSLDAHTLETAAFWLIGGTLSAWILTFLSGPKALRRPI